MRMDIYTDGSCHNQNGKLMPAGWAFIVVHPTSEERILAYKTGYMDNATSQIAELIAAFEAIKSANLPTMVEIVNIHSDSSYLVNCFLQRWYKKWEITGYSGIKNEHYWRPLIALVHKMRKESNIKVHFIKVKGHNGNKYNELADKLAVEARKNGTERNKGYHHKIAESMCNG